MIELREVGKRYGATRAIDGVSLHIARGELVVLIGPSGSGKSTLLKTINRLVEHDSGMVLFRGEQVRSFRPEDLRRRMGYAIQSIGLFPHWSVARNIATVPELLGWPAARIAVRVDELLALLGLEPASYRARYPHQLSGGQQQRRGHRHDHRGAAPRRREDRHHEQRDRQCEQPGRGGAVQFVQPHTAAGDEAVRRHADEGQRERRRGAGQQQPQQHTDANDRRGARPSIDRQPRHGLT